MRDESEKEVIHRLEAFSDIVIGFSLAQLALNLTLPKHGIDVFASDHGIRAMIGLAVTFALICAIWWSHHRLFRHTFVPTPLNILANFAALGGVIFLSYSMQVLVHVGLGDRIAYAMYTGSYAWILLLFAFLWWSGIRLRGDRLAGALRAISLRFAVRTTVIGVWLAAFTVIGLQLGPQSAVNQFMVLLLVVALAAHRVVLRRSAKEALNSPSA